MRKSVRILWVDGGYMWSWTLLLQSLGDVGYQVTALENPEPALVLNMCRDKDVVAIHCSSRYPMPALRELLEEIRYRYPLIKIALGVNCHQRVLPGLVDFYIKKPIRFEDMRDLLNSNV